MVDIKGYSNTLRYALKESEKIFVAMRNDFHVEREKGDKDFALDADLKIEQKIRGCISSMTKENELPIYGEEYGWSKKDAGNPDTFWLIDPIDGTANYSSQIPLCGVAIALVHESNLLLSGLNFPFLGECYIAIKNRGAYLNDLPIQVAHPKSMNTSIVGFGDFAVGEDAARKNQLRFRTIINLAERALRVRMLGSAAIQLAWVACGRLGASITLSNNSWDVQAGVLLVREAGGEVFDLDGNDHDFNSDCTLASSSSLKTELVSTVNYPALLCKMLPPVPFHS
jgi:myo-inositol-1(or 4)-monophosphatase